MSPGYIDRFAPSPTGELHLGHAFSALVGWREARAAGGRFLLRIEDLDQGRSRPEFVEAIYRDLAWLGVEWEQPVLFQSARLPAYRTALERLTGLGLTYPCTCTRRDIAEAVAAPQEGALPPGPDGLVYPGTCRDMDSKERARLMAEGLPHALRLDMGAAMAAVPHLTWRDREQGRVVADPRPFGDVVLARKDTPTSYHLAVTVADHAK